MAQKRMFSLSVVDTDKFLEMPVSARLLYYELGMRADDDGFVSNWKKILLFTGLKEDDLKILIAKNFIIPFESGVIVIRHWRMNNYLQNDRTKPTIYQEELKELNLDNNNVYNLYTECIHSIDKNSIEEISIEDNNLKKDNKVISSCNKNNNVIIVDIYEFIEKNFGRTLSPLEYEKINSWLLLFSEDIIKYAIEVSVMNGKRTFNYVDGILKNWNSCNYKSLEEIKNAEKKEDNKEIKPNWYGKDIKKEELTKEEREEMNKLLSEFKGDE